MSHYVFPKIKGLLFLGQKNMGLTPKTCLFSTNMPLYQRWPQGILPVCGTSPRLMAACRLCCLPRTCDTPRSSVQCPLSLYLISLSHILLPISRLLFSFVSFPYKGKRRRSIAPSSPSPSLYMIQASVIAINRS